MEHLQQLVVQLIDQYGYAGLFFGLALGNIGFPIGSEVVLPLAGALSATGHLPNIWATIGAALGGELLGQSTGYAVGRYGGRPFVARYGKYVRFHENELAHFDKFFVRYGTFAIFICRFVPVLRGVVGVPAGITRMNIFKFLGWTAAGSAIFCGVLIWVGHVLGRHVDKIVPLIREGGTALLVAVAIGAVAIGVFLYVRSRSRKPAG